MPKTAQYSPTMESRSRRVIVVVFPDVQTLDVSGPAEVFARAGRLAGEPLYNVIVVSVQGGLIVTSAGYAITTRSLASLRLRPTDTVLIAGGGGIRDAVADARLARWLRRAARVVERIGSVCSGAFVLAAAGLLDDLRATTHWAACRRLERLRPQVKVDREAIFVVDGKVWTSAGVTTGIDMALAMVEEDHGRALVDRLAAHLVLYVRRPGLQSQWSAALVAQHDAGNPMAPALTWARRHLDRLNVATLARHAGMSPRTFHRRCIEHLDTTPARLIERLRVERARILLSTSHLSAKEIAHQCGLRDGAQLARLCQRTLGLAPREYRTLFKRRSVVQRPQGAAIEGASAGSRGPAQPA